MKSRVKICCIASVLGLMSCSKAQIELSFEGFTNDTVILMSAPIKDYVNASADSELKIDTLLIENNELQIPAAAESMYWNLSFKETDDNSPNFSRRSIDVITQPKDRLKYKVWRTAEQFEYEVKGSDYAEGVAAFDRYVLPVALEIDRMDRSVAENWEVIRPLYDKRRVMAAEWLKENLESPAAIYVLAAEVASDLFLEYYDRLLPMIERSELAPILKERKYAAEMQVATTQAKVRVKEGAVAPLFSLQDQDGHVVELSSFRGRWVVLDFWGSWCGYCINGIPTMLQAYEEVKDKCEFIGIACNDKMDAWLAALDKYPMPWVQVFNSNDVAPAENVILKYAIEAYPTKMIITPEGVIHKIFVGEESDFYATLDRVVK
uniref:TlpA family protein disulfide reductase n=1 Tax=Alistipes sp. TaxID=1872444 RepID=UPI00405793FC